MSFLNLTSASSRAAKAATVGALGATTAQTNVTPIDPAARDVQAGFTSMFLEGEPTGDSYFAVGKEIEEVGYSPTTQATNEMLHSEESGRMTNMIPDILLDESLTDEQKKEALGLALSANRQENPMSYQYMRDLLEAPEPELEENKEYLSAKTLVMDSLANIDEYNRALDGVNDLITAASDEKFQSAITDLGELIIPFWEQSQLAELQGKLGGSAMDRAEAFLLMGNNKVALRKAFEAVPAEHKAQAATAFAQAIISANSNTYMTNELNTRSLVDAVIHGDYTDTHKWIDNIVSLADASIIFGAPVKWAAKTLKLTAQGRRVRAATRSATPNSAANAANATEARHQLDSIIDDETGEIARALTGGTREDAVYGNVLPEVSLSGAGLRAKVSHNAATAEQAAINNGMLSEVMAERRAGVLTEAESKSAHNTAVERMHRALGVESRKEMYEVEATDTGAVIRGAFGPKDGGYADAEQAIVMAEQALRRHGVAPEDIYLLQRNEAGEYVKADSLPKEAGDYLAGYEFKYENSFKDVLDWDKFDVNLNFLDRGHIASYAGISRALFDPASMLDPHIYKGAVTAVDREAFVTKLFEDQALDFSKTMRGMRQQDQDKVMAYIERANDEGLVFNPSAVKADYGFSDTQMEALTKFRKYWDTMWAVDNRLATKSMKEDGFVVLENTASDTRIYGKPVSHAHVKRDAGVLRPDSDSIEEVSGIVELLDRGTHELLKMRKPISHAGEKANYVLAPKSEIRDVRASDAVTPYRHGYHKVDYKHPHFIVEEVVVDGVTKRVPIATAETMRDAKVYMDRLVAENPGIKLFQRSDIKDEVERAEFLRDVAALGDSSMQRFRGARLEDATASVRGRATNNIKDPLEVMSDAARAYGRKVSLGGYLDGTKRRFLDNYKDVLPSEMGKPVMPASSKDIGEAGSKHMGEVANARSMYEYINYLEHGYANSMSTASKSFVRDLADAVGLAKLGGAERGAEKVLRKLSDISISQKVKSAAFKLLIAYNPLRQFFMNSHQAMLLLSQHPVYCSTKLPGDFAAMTMLKFSDGKGIAEAAKYSGRSESEVALMWKEFKKSGLIDAITNHNLARETMQDIATGNSLKHGPVRRAAKALESVPEKIGFQSGEYVNLTTAWLAEYNAAKKTKTALNQTDFRDVAAKARNFTFNMNRAGDMRYNHGPFGMLFQFFQVPHKAILSVSTNRLLTKKQKTKLVAYNLTAYGIPAGFVADHFSNILPDKGKHPEAYALAEQGLEWAAINKLAELATGEASNIDFSSAAPINVKPMQKFFSDLLEANFAEAIGGTPGGGLFVGNNPRVTNLIKTAAKFLNPRNEELNADPVKMSDVYQSFARLSSGYSNVMKAKLAMNYHKAYNSRNEVVDARVSTPEAIAMAFGFSTEDHSRVIELNSAMYKSKDALKKDVDKWYADFARLLSNRDMTAEDIEYVNLFMSQAMIAWADEPTAIDRITFKLEQAQLKGEDHLYEAWLKMAGERPIEVVESDLRGLQFPDYNPQAKKNLLDVLDGIKQFNGDN